MSIMGPFGTRGDGAALGVTGTRGTVLIPGAEAGAVGVTVAGGMAAGGWGNAGAGGDATGAETGESWAEVGERKVSSSRSEAETRNFCWISILMSVVII